MYQTYAHKNPIIKKSEDEPRRRQWKWLLLLPLLLVLFFGWRAIASSRNLAKVKALQEQMATATPEQRPQLFQDMRSAMANLTSDQRDLLFKEGQKRQEQELDRYLAMSKNEQKAYLDDRINRMQKMRANSSPIGNQKGGTGGQGQGLPAGATAAAGFGGGKGFGGPNGKSKNPDDIESRKKKGLDRTSVDLRAKNDRFRKDLEARMKERGIQPPSGGRGR